jgi:hypothetical protein
MVDKIIFNRIRLLFLCLTLSVLTHILIVYALRMFGTYDFTTPVALSPVVEVDLAKLADTASSAETPEKQEHEETGHAGGNSTTTGALDPPAAQLNQEQLQPEPKPAFSSVNNAERVSSPIRNSEAPRDNSPDENQKPAAGLPTHPLSPVSDFMSMNYEKLTYQISMFGLPVGSAELEAKHEKGEIWLTLRVRSNAVISNFYPVDDLVETRHIGGNFIINKIKQQEGTFKSDTRFTIFLRDKSVFWIDRISNLSVREAIPTEEVLDTLSGIYFLRNRQLQVGKTETLHIYDSECYADVPVEILRRETVRLPNLTKVDTLVVQPLQKSAGIFRRTGDILIWMTDDENKVPVKIVTSVMLGKVTVELVSAESKPLKVGVTGIK